jgi:hypothetical protein
MSVDFESRVKTVERIEIVCRILNSASEDYQKYIDLGQCHIAKLAEPVISQYSMELLTTSLRNYNQS